MRLIGADGEQVGIVETRDALKRAREEDLDLVLVGEAAQPPVAKLLDYGRYRFEQQQQVKEARKRSRQQEMKSIKFRVKIDDHDYETKKRNVVRFLEAGSKVKVTIMFRGREQSRPELGFRLLQRLGADVADYGFVETSAKQDGRNMTMVLGPHKKKAEAKAEAKAAKQERAAAREAEEAEERAERTAANADHQVAAKKERRRSENLDPEIDA